MILGILVFYSPEIVSTYPHLVDWNPSDPFNQHRLGVCNIQGGFIAESFCLGFEVLAAQLKVQPETKNPNILIKSNNENNL